MSDEFKLRKDMEFAAKAQAFLNDEAFAKARKDVREAILQSWEDCPIRDREGAHELKLMLKLLNDLEGYLGKAMEQGKFAAEELRRDKSFPQRLAERLRVL